MHKRITTILLALVACGGIYASGVPGIRGVALGSHPKRALGLRTAPVPSPVTTPAPVPPAVGSIVISYDSSAASNITVTFNAGEPGAPAGFTIQWMTLSDYVALGNQWPATFEVPNPAAPSFCTATFMGAVSNNGCATYNLRPWQSVTVTIGDSLYDNCAVSSPCAGVPLLCNTSYVFRATSLAPSAVLMISNTITASTLPCAGGGSCTYTQGYWRTHPDAWPVTSLTLGTVTYQAAQLMAILENPAQSNGLVILAHQLIAAKLNIANGADPTAIQQTVIDADNMIAGLVVPPIGNGYLPPAQTSQLTETLTQYNEGTIGPGHCDN
jgi:hypothetical protein